MEVKNVRIRINYVEIQYPDDPLKVNNLSILLDKNSKYSVRYSVQTDQGVFSGETETKKWIYGTRISFDEVFSLRTNYQDKIVGYFELKEWGMEEAGELKAKVDLTSVISRHWQQQQGMIAKEIDLKFNKGVVMNMSFWVQTITDGPNANLQKNEISHPRKGVERLKEVIALQSIEYESIINDLKKDIVSKRNTISSLKERLGTLDSSLVSSNGSHAKSEDHGSSQKDVMQKEQALMQKEQALMQKRERENEIICSAMEKALGIQFSKQDMEKNMELICKQISVIQSEKRKSDARNEKFKNIIRKEKDKVKNLQQEMETTQKLTNELQQACTEQRQSLEYYESENKRLNSLTHQPEKEINELHQIKLDLEKKLGIQNSTVESLKVVLNEFEERALNAENLAEHHAQNCQKLKKELENLTRKNNELTRSNEDDEIFSMAHEIQIINEEKKEMEMKAEKLEKEYKDLQQKFSEQEKRLSSTMNEKKMEKKELSVSQKTIFELQNEKTELMKEISKKNRENEDFQLKLNELTESHTSLINKMDKMKQSVILVTTVSKEQKKEVQEKLSDLRKRYEKLQLKYETNVKVLNGKISQYRQKIESCSQELSQLHDEKGMLVEALSSDPTLNRIQEFQSMYQSMKQTIENRHSNEMQRQEKRLKNEMSANENLRSELSVLRKVIQEQEDEMKDYLLTIDGFEKVMEEKSSLISQLQQENGSLARLVMQSNAELSESNSNLSKMQKQNSMLTQKVEALRNTGSRNVTTSKDLKESLKLKHDFQRLTIDHEKLSSVHENLLQTIEKEKIASKKQIDMLENKISIYKQEIKTLQANVANLKSLYDTTKEENEETIWKLKKSSHEKQQQLADCTKKLALIEHTYSEEKSEIENKLKKLTDLKEKNENKQCEQLQQLEEFKEKNIALGKKYFQQVITSQKFERKLQKAETTISEMAETIASLKSTIFEMKSHEDANFQNYEAEIKKIIHSDEVENLKRKASDCEEVIHSLRSENENLTNEKNSLQDKLADHEKKLGNSNSVIDELKSNTNDLNEQVKLLQSELEDINQRYQSLPNQQHRIQYLERENFRLQKNLNLCLKEIKELHVLCDSIFEPHNQRQHEEQVRKLIASKRALKEINHDVDTLQKALESDLLHVQMEKRFSSLNDEMQKKETFKKTLSILHSDEKEHIKKLRKLRKEMKYMQTDSPQHKRAIRLAEKIQNSLRGVHNLKKSHTEKLNELQSGRIRNEEYNEMKKESRRESLHQVEETLSQRLEETKKQSFNISEKLKLINEKLQNRDSLL